MELIEGPPPGVQRLGILAGSFNPPTHAHMALAAAALAVVDEVLFVVPRAFPHKEYHGATLDQRMEMLIRLAANQSRLSAAIADGGLFIDIAREAREHFPAAQLYFLCGRDAAERIIHWNYETPGCFARMLNEFHLLVAPRSGRYTPSDDLLHGVHPLDLGDFDECSSTRVREAAASGKDWRNLVPVEIHALVEKFYE